MADYHNLWALYSSLAVATTSLLLLAAALLRNKKREKRKTRCAWVKNWHRTEAGTFHQLMAELKVSDPYLYRKYVRMDVETFEVLLEKTTPYLQKQITVMRKPISTAEYLAVTLRFLATGESYSSLEFQFRISKSTLSNTIPYVCNVIYTVLKDEYLACPQSELEWLNIAKEFQDRWQFPNCLGAGDGKHIRLLCPSNSGSEYYNYKGYYSLVLMAFVGPEYQFLFVDVACQGSVSDGCVFRKTSLWKAMEENSIYLPQAKPLPQNPDPVFEDTSDIDIDYFFVCDDAFPLGLHLMKPYSKQQLSEERRIFNYRLSRARRVSENAFGILAARFGVLHTMMRLGPDKATKVVLACCALHNMLLRKSSCSYCPRGSMDYENENGDVITGSWRESASSNSSNFRSMPKCKERSPKNAEDMRDIICYYVNGTRCYPLAVEGFSSLIF